MSDSEENPTLENVLPEFKRIPAINPMDNFMKASPPAQRCKEKGAIVAVPGLSPCPWCGSNMKQPKEETYIAICEKNPKHIAEWTVWPG